MATLLEQAKAVPSIRTSPDVITNEIRDLIRAYANDEVSLKQVETVLGKKPGSAYALINRVLIEIVKWG